MINKLAKFWLVAVLVVGGLLASAPVGVMAGPVNPDDPEGPGDSQRFGAVRGVVVDDAGERVENATIRLVHARTGRVVATVESDGEGMFGIRHVRVGHYLVKAGKRDVGVGSARVGVRPNAVARVRVVLKER